MSWYDKILDEGFVVRGSIDMTNNTFAKEKKYRYEMEHGEIIKDDKGNYKRILDDEGVPLSPKTVNVERDAYIDCEGKNKQGLHNIITCLTTDDFGCRKHLFMASAYTGEMNKLRKYYRENIGSEDEISETEYLYDDIGYGNDKDGNKNVEMVPRLDKKTGEHQTKKVWFDDIMIEGIEKDGVIFDIQLLEGEAHFKSYDWKMLCSLMKAKTLRRRKDKSIIKKNPFVDDYLEWNPYKIPEEDMELYKKWMNKFERDEDGKLNMDDMRLISKLNTSFFDENQEQLNWDVQRVSKVKDNKNFIHSQGLWEDYISFLKGAK